MNINSKLASVAVVSAIAGATFLGANTASAATTGESLVSRIAERFGVSETEVQTVIDEYKTEQQAEREAAKDQHLTGLVEAGTLTDEQRAELEAFHDERSELKDELREQDLTREEIKEAMEGLRDEIEAWAEAEGIDLDELKPEGFEDREDRKERRQERRGELRDLFEEEFGDVEDGEDLDDGEDEDVDADDEDVDTEES